MLMKTEKIQRKTIEHRRLQHRKNATYMTNQCARDSLKQSNHLSQNL